MGQALELLAGELETAEVGQDSMEESIDELLRSGELDGHCVRVMRALREYTRGTQVLIAEAREEVTKLREELE